ncbi:MAG TPA: WbqC family protein [Bacteroidales bacterium]|nr:WbqC family protein [Bacteroidales bacterium]
MRSVLLTTSYFPSVQYCSKLVHFTDIYLEYYDNYDRQTYRNRCNILSANGAICLSIPVIKPAVDRQKTGEVLIDYSYNWQRNHFQAIKSAYRKSAYYDYYIDELESFFKIQEKSLFMQNYKILLKLLEIIGIDRNIRITKEYAESNPSFIDLRYTMQPKIQKNSEDPHFFPQPYHQVYPEKFRFMPNLSVLDLIFNEGPLCLQFLEESYK